MRKLCLASLFFLGACYTDGEPLVTERPLAQTDAEIAFVKMTLDRLQAPSIKANREYCGYIGLDRDGDYVASPPQKGRKGSCSVKNIPEDINILASYHTHGGYSEDYDSELPSADDIKSDTEEGTDGYISTPGGRVWFTDTKSKTARLLCGLSCIESDPNFESDPTLPIEASYTFVELLDML